VRASTTKSQPANLRATFDISRGIVPERNFALKALAATPWITLEPRNPSCAIARFRGQPQVGPRPYLPTTKFPKSRTQFKRSLPSPSAKEPGEGLPVMSRARSLPNSHQSLDAEPWTRLVHLGQAKKRISKIPASRAARRRWAFKSRNVTARVPRFRRRSATRNAWSFAFRWLKR
jgi:hypothetical protein